MKRKYQIDTEENKRYLEELRDELLNFGVKFVAPGGGSFYLGGDGNPMLERDIETWITCRMAHVYSIGSMLKMPQAKSLVEGALEGLQGRLKDTANGGWYPGVTPEGKPLPTKQCYGHAFVILAATSAYLAKMDGAYELIEEALEVYDRYFWDDEIGLAVDTYNTEFTVCDPYRGINANMHTVEAFLAVADALGKEDYRARAGRVIDHVIGWAKENNWRIPEHFTVDWEADLELNRDKPDDPFKPYGATCGHGIEWARLITQWALSTFGDAKKASAYIEAAKNLFNRAIADGWNVDGAKGIVYTTDWDGKPVVRDRMHWTLAEAINTSAVLYRTTNDARYKDYYAQFMEYLDEQVHDKVNGSWFHQLDENNRLKETVWPGKSDIYHALQATIIPYAKVDISIAAFIKAQLEN